MNSTLPLCRVQSTIGLWQRTVVFCLLVLGSFIVSESAFAQDVHKVTGTVSDFETKQGLVGAIVKVKGTKVGVVVRRSDGQFSIDVPKNSSQILVISLVGKKTQEVNVASKDNVTIVMRNDVLELDKVVVTAVGIEQEKRSLGYSTQEVSGTQLTDGRSPNLVNALVGKVAGVQINSSSGSPGAASSIRLRGISSLLGNNEPAFVIDGVLIDNTDFGSAYNAATNDPTTGLGNFVDGVDQPNRILDINPDDIESINVLKGAAATALYGLGASAGAIVITTKKGHRDGNVNIQYSYSRQMDEVNKLPEMQTTYTQGFDGGILYPSSSQALRRTSWGPAYTELRYKTDPTYLWDKNGRPVLAADAPSGAKVVPYDNLKNFFQIGETNSHSLSISAGNSTGSYHFSVSNLGASGIIPNSKFDRTTLRLNAEYGLFADTKISGSAQYSNTEGQRTQKGSNVGGVMLSLLRTPITFDISNGIDSKTDPAMYYLPDGRERTFRGTPPGYDNPYFTVNKNVYTDRTERWIASTQLDYFPQNWFGKSLLGDLTGMFRVGGDFYTMRDQQNFAVGSAISPDGHVANSTVTSKNINVDLLFTLNRNLSDDIKASLTFGTQLTSMYAYDYIINGDGLTIPDFYNPSNAASFTASSSQTEIRRGAGIASLNLSLANYLFLQANGRLEQSTTLPVNNNQFLYGNLSAGWVFTENLGWKEDDFLSFGKLRASYASVGSDAPAYSLTTPYVKVVLTDGWIQNAFQFPFNGISGFSQAGSIGNTGLRPEKRNEFEVGLDLKFLSNRVSLDVAYYTTQNIDQIMPARVSLATGYQSLLLNAATMKNSGIEVVLNATPYRDKDFSIDAGVNFSTFSNTVTELAPGIDNLFIAGFTSGAVLAVKGMPYGQIYGADWLKDSQGRIIVGDDGLPQVDEKPKFFGANIPDFILGGTLGINYKNISLSAIIDWKKGGKIWNGTRSSLNYFGVAKATENRGTMNGTYDGITIEKGIIKGVRFDTTSQSYVTNDIVVKEGLGQNFWGPDGVDNSASPLIAPFVEDAGWFRLKEIRINYRLPKEWTDALGIFQGLDVYVTGRNLLLITNYTGVDPETSLIGASNGQGLDYFNNPGTRTYGFGIHASF